MGTDVSKPIVRATPRLNDDLPDDDEPIEGVREVVAALTSA